MQNVSAVAYRRDIDGLRGVAVLAVIFGHAGLPWFSGGFVGVDVFFVISGFLITSIIKSDLDNGRFSYTRFYERRIRRLLPTLVLVVGVTTLASAVVMAPADYVVFAPSIAAVAGFVSNIYFWRQTGYFSPHADEQPLLHTWSLSVEEQFYLLFPVIACSVYRNSSPRCSLRAVILATALISFAASCYGVLGPKSATFYLLPTRWWELAAGALLSLHPDMRQPRESRRRILRAVGMLLVLGSVFAFDPSWPFPGPLAAIPVLGACLLIAPQLRSSIKQYSILEKPVFVFPGKISYALYLWHFPLFALARRIAPDGAHDGFTAVPLSCVLIIVTFALAWLSWRYVEQPLRQTRSRISTGPALFATAAAGLAIFAVLGLTLGSPAGISLLYGTRGQQDMAQDTANDLALAFEARQFRDGPCMSLDASRLFTAGCRFGRRDRKTEIVFWGDSHAEMLRPVLDRLAVTSGRAGTIAGVFGCPPALGVSASNSPACRAANDQVMRTIAADRDVHDVVPAAYWPAYFSGRKLRRHEPFWLLSAGDVAAPIPASDAEVARSNRQILTDALQKTVLELEKHGKRVWILGPLPESPTDPARNFFARSLAGRLQGMTHTPFRRIGDRYWHREASAADAIRISIAATKAEPVWWHEHFCPVSDCHDQFDGHALYMDDNHLNRRGADFAANALRRVFNEATAHK